MSAAPQWLDDVMAEFGRAAGLSGLSLGERGVAALTGDNGTVLLFEYAYPRLTVTMTVQVRKTPEVTRQVLALADPMRRGRFAIRSGFLPHSDKAFFALPLNHEDVTLPNLNAAFAELRRLAERFLTGGAA